MVCSPAANLAPQGHFGRLAALGSGAIPAVALGEAVASTPKLSDHSLGDHSLDRQEHFFAAQPTP
ncbi:MAG: hypothetical protein ACYST0_10675 [Planctomycetota bacterium]|jgi:hypothetical protein